MIEFSLTSLFQLINTVLVLAIVYFGIRFLIVVPKRVKKMEKDIEEIKSVVMKEGE